MSTESKVDQPKFRTGAVVRFGQSLFKVFGRTMTRMGWVYQIGPDGGEVHERELSSGDPR